MDKEVIALKRARKAFEQVFPECFQSGEHPFIQNEIPTATSILASALLNQEDTPQIENDASAAKDAKELLVDQPSVREMIKTAHENIKLFKDEWQLKFIRNMAERVAQAEEEQIELWPTEQQLRYIKRHYEIVQDALKNQKRLE